MSDIITLPQVLNAHLKQEESAFFIFKHLTDRPAVKNKLLLQQNLISFLQNGEKVIHFGDKVQVINNEQIALLSSGNCLTTEKLSNEQKYCSILFFFDNSALTNFFVKYSSIIDELKLKKVPLNEPFVVFPKDNFIRHFIQSLDFILQNKSANINAVMQLKFEEFMLYLLEKHPETLLSFQGAKKEEYSDFEIKSAVEQNITANLTNEELAFLCNTSVSTFKRRFVKLYNTSPNQYFIQRKMEMAAILLMKNEHPSEVFFKVGYENHSSFSQSFKQYFGISPKHYQQQNIERLPIVFD